jgi:hypothetical protein
VATTGDLFVKRRKLAPSKITEMCENEGLDPSDAKNRKKMSRMRKEKTLQD